MTEDINTTYTRMRQMWESAGVEQPLLNANALELIDGAFSSVHYARGLEPDILRLRELQLARRNAMIELIAAITGRDSEELYEFFSERLPANVERRLAEQ